MRSRLVLVPLLLAALLPGCRDAKVAHYRVPKEKPEPVAPGAPAAGPETGTAMANTAVPTAEGEGLSWTAPAHWKPKAPGAMRKGSYAVPGENGADADLSITAFPGDVGGDLANINRWRGQIQLPPLTADALAANTRHLEHNGLNFTVVDFASPGSANPQRILGAIVPLNGATWFIKLMGSDAVVSRERPAFLAFLETVRAPAQP